MGLHSTVGEGFYDVGQAHQQESASGSRNNLNIVTRNMDIHDVFSYLYWQA